jgi:hypothetical protein
MRKNYFARLELRRSAHVTQQENSPAGCSKRLFSKAAASEEARRTLRYVEPLSEARTKLADFFSILLYQERSGPSISTEPGASNNVMKVVFTGRSRSLTGA